MILPYFQINATSDERTNSLIVRAPESIQYQIQKILDVIDNPKNTKSLEITKINYISAKELSQILQTIINYKYTKNPGICIGDDKTNKIILLEEPKNLIELKVLINKLDVKTNSYDTTLIKKLKNSNPIQITNILNNLR